MSYENRIPVPVSFAYENLVDETIYLYNAEDDNMKLDPWRTIAGLDREVRGEQRYIIEVGSTGEKLVDGDFKVYVPVETLNRIGRQDLVASAKVRWLDR